MAKVFPLWDQLIDKKEDFIGCVLEDHEPGFPVSTTIVTDIRMDSFNGSSIFVVEGKEFDCSFNVEYGGVTGGEAGWLTFARYGGATHRIKRKEKPNA